MTRFNVKTVLAGAAALLVSQGVFARDDHLRFPIADALATPDAQAKVNPNVKLYWGEQPFAKPTQQIGVFTTSKKTNAFNKSDKDACNWTILSAVIALQERAVKDGGNAVVNIHSIYRNDDVDSDSEFVCGVGTFTSAVALRGTVVKLP